MHSLSYPYGLSSLGYRVDCQCLHRLLPQSYTVPVSYVQSSRIFSTHILIIIISHICSLFVITFPNASLLHENRGRKPRNGSLDARNSCMHYSPIEPSLTRAMSPSLRLPRFRSLPASFLARLLAFRSLEPLPPSLYPPAGD